MKNETTEEPKVEFCHHCGCPDQKEIKGGTLTKKGVHQFHDVRCADCKAMLWGRAWFEKGKKEEVRV